MKSRDRIIAFARESLKLPPGIDFDLIPFETRGSDRSYYRIRRNREESAVLVHYDPNRIENTYFVDINFFLSEIGVSVPEIICHDPAACLITMEDLGDADLRSFKNQPWETRRKLYEKTLILAHLIHSFPERRFPSDRVKLAEEFNSGMYLWERNYFRENFVRKFCGIENDPAFNRRLEAELQGLAERLLTSGRSLVHRDLQSPNILIRAGEPYLIDFQGMRFGTRFYDLGSLLLDPYADISGTEREELLSFYYQLTGSDIDRQSFRNAFWEASAQRLMQALGAYGFLGLAKGLNHYLLNIPAGIRNLRIAAENSDSLPCLHELSIRCEEALSSSPDRCEKVSS